MTNSLEPSVGSWAEHVEGHLDPRQVIEVSDDKSQVWLRIGTQSVGPLPAENYAYYTGDGGAVPPGDAPDPETNRLG